MTVPFCKAHALQGVAAHVKGQDYISDQQFTTAEADDTSQLAYSGLLPAHL